MRNYHAFVLFAINYLSFCGVKKKEKKWGDAFE